MTYVATDRPRIGWIGAGRMGYQLASRLLGAGHDVAVYNRTRAKAEPLADMGGHTEEDFATLIVEQARRSGMTLEPEK
jgi:3-hydroxyisobutyrate dehydrogenase-like beta-hydroxyacid dehydrogenase